MEATAPCSDNEARFADFALHVCQQSFALRAAGVDVDHGEAAGHACQAIGIGKFKHHLSTRRQAHAVVIANRWPFAIVGSKRECGESARSVLRLPSCECAGHERTPLRWGRERSA
jgi:hypothetical protein